MLKFTGHEIVVYFDSTRKFSSLKLDALFKKVSITGVLAKLSNLNLKCYTNSKMYDWFEESADNFTNIHMIDTSLVIMNRKNFINALVMKAWITCALVKECIAPIGSYISPCCGCHRYEQSSLTIIISYFFANPINNSNLPAYALNTQELSFL